MTGTGDRFCAFNSNIFLCFSFWGVWEIYHTEGIHGNSLQNFYLPKLNPGDQICAYFVISLFCGAPTVFVLLAMPIIAACPLRSHFYTSCHISHPGDGVCSSQTKDQAIMLFLIKCSGVTDQLLHQGDVLKDNWEGAISGLDNWESGSLICFNNVCTRQNMRERGPQPQMYIEWAGANNKLVFMTSENSI